MKEKVFKQLYNKKLKQFYNRYFHNKNFDEALFLPIRSAFKELLISQMKFLMIQDCLKKYSANNPLSLREQQEIEENLLGVETISNKIDEIFNYILKGYLN